MMDYLDLMAGCVSSNDELKKGILIEAHCSKFAMHPGNTKMYRNLIPRFWWNGMKRDITKYVSKFLTCQ